MASPIASSSAVPMSVDSQHAARAPRQRPATPPSPDCETECDRYYGQKPMADLAAFVVRSLFDVSDAGDMPPTPPLSPNGKAQVPELLDFIAYALYRTRLPDAVVHHALFLLSRLKARYPSARGTASSPHRLFLSSLMLSSKINMDDTYSNRSWTIVGGHFFALKEVNQMERELFAFLGWNVVVKAEDLAMFVKRVEMDMAASKVAGGRRRTHFASLLPALEPTATPPLSPPPERDAERSKRRRESSCSRSAAAEAAAIALLRPSSSSRGPFAAQRKARLSSNDSSVASSVVSSTFPSPRSISPRTPASPHSPHHRIAGAEHWQKIPQEYKGDVVYRAGSSGFVPASF